MRTPEFYKRELYLDRIKPFVNTQMIKVLTGQRRVGKSFLIFQLMDDIRLSYPSADLIYINKELFEFDSLKDYSDLIQYVTLQRKNLADKCFYLLMKCRIS
jgi:predicted AAA+ superfamily ATPase